MKVRIEISDEMKTPDTEPIAGDLQHQIAYRVVDILLDKGDVHSLAPMRSGMPHGAHWTRDSILEAVARAARAAGV